MAYTPFNTGNPIGTWGSVDPRDLVDNAAILDRWVNDQTITQWRDRFGIQRLTWNGMEVAFQQAQSDRQDAFDAEQAEHQADFDAAQAQRESDFNDFLLASGYQFVGDYDTDGPLTITQVNQIFSKDGEFWRASASLDLPYTTVEDWAIDQPKFVSVGDAALRQELSQSSGSDIVGYRGTTIYKRLSLEIHPEDFGAIGDGIADDTTAFQEAIDFCASNKSEFHGTPGKTYKITYPCSITGVKAIGNFSRILALMPSATIENDAISLYGDGVEFSGWIMQGATDSESGYDSRTYRGIHVRETAKNFKVCGNTFLYFKVASVQTKGIGVTNALPMIGEIAHNYCDGGDGRCMNGIVVLGGKSIRVHHNVSMNTYNQAFTVSDASRLTPIAEYGKNIDIWLDENQGYITDPPADVTQTAADSGLKIAGGSGLRARHNTIRYVGSKTSPTVTIGKGLEITLYDLAQQRDRNDGTLGTNEGVYMPYDEKTVLPEASNNLIIGFSIGIYLNGIYNAKVCDNVIASTQVGILYQSQGATIQGAPYTQPSAEGPGVQRGFVQDNNITSLDTRAIGAGNAFIAHKLNTNYNRIIETEYRGIINNRFDGTNGGVQNYKRDADGRQYGVSQFAEGDLVNYVDISAGSVSQVVSGSLQQGGVAKLNLAFEGVATDYHVSVHPNWNTTVWITGKTALQFILNFGSPAPAGGGRVYWKITPAQKWIS